MFTAPNEEKTHEYMKNGLTTAYYVPVPDDDEMEYMARYVFNGLNYRAIWGSLRLVVASGRTVDGWRDVAYFVGNVPRHVFRPAVNYAVLHTLESDMWWLVLQKILKRTEEVTAGLSDSLIDIVPSENRRSYTRRPRPGWVM